MRGKKGSSVFVLLIVLLWSLPADALFAQTVLKRRAIFPKLYHTVIDDIRGADKIIIKFHEGTHIRERSGQWVALVDTLSVAEEKLLARVNLTKEKVADQVKAVNRLLNSRPGLHWERLFNRPEPELERERIEGEKNIGEELADLNLYYAIDLDQAVAKDIEKLIEQLNAFDIVETAYLEPIPEPAVCIDIDPPTPNFTDRQGYLNPAPTGIDARYAWTFEGGRGEGVRIIDVEGGWNLTHESLPNVFFQSGLNSTIPLWRQHGTAVLGEIVGCGVDERDEREYGVTGIANQAAIGISSIFPSFGAARAISNGAAQLNAGDIILIELQTFGTRCDLNCNCRVCGREESCFLPSEDSQAVFDAIKAATARDIIVVEAAGNGSNNLDCPEYRGRFDRSVRDSGAIMVGAGSASGRVPLGFTNYGSRVDVQGWGQSVMTAGYGTIRINGSDQNQWYTSGFSGTSSASPIVVGAVACVQGITLAQDLPPLRPDEMLDLLRSTGTPQADDDRQIGPLPNLRDAISSTLVSP